MKRKRYTKRILGVVAVIGLVIVIRQFFGMLVGIPAESNCPMLCAGDQVWVSRTSFGIRLPLGHVFGYKRLWPDKVQRGTWLAYNDPTQTERWCIEVRDVCIGYAMALPGDTVWIAEDGTISDRYDTENGCINVLEIPQAGRNIYLTPWNIRFYQRLLEERFSRPSDVCIEISSDNRHLLVNGRQTSVLCFDQNCYWISSGNPDNYHDSRSQGLIPESHLIGAIKTVVFSLPPDRPWYAPFRFERTLLTLPSASTPLTE